MSAKTTFLQNFLNDVGNSVHSMNSIAVALSEITDTTSVPNGLNISWNIGNTKATKEMSRNFAIRAAIVYTIEALYEYLRIISSSLLWMDKDRIFSQIYGDSKATKTYNFLKGIENIEKEWIILVELLGHWRNKVVHSYTSNAKLSSSKRQFIKEKKSKLKQELHNFDIDIALDNFNYGKNTLKDASTLITMAIKCARAVESYYIAKLPSIDNIDTYIDLFTNDKVFSKILLQQKGKKRTRQVIKWLDVNYNYLEYDIKRSIFEKLNN